jgi:hypothetical protein
MSRRGANDHLMLRQLRDTEEWSRNESQGLGKEDLR